MENTSYSKTRILVECALLIAMGTVLAQIKIIRMPNGGSVTALSMLPFIMISFRHGTKWGLIAGLANGILQMLLGGIYTPPAGTFSAMAGAILLDYLLAYIFLGLAQLFSKPFGAKHRAGGIICGTVSVCVLRFLCAFISGFLIWGSLTEDGFGAVIYSLGYNAAYLVPESILTVLGVFVLYKAAPQLFRTK